MNIQSKFVVIKHEAKKAGLHYDLRFRIPKSKRWTSFAVRKGVPTTVGTKVVAIKTRIHTEEGSLFTGTLEKGYGAGKFTKWDSGSCVILKYSKRHMVIDFKGSKVKGIYHLINTAVINKYSKNKKDSAYLLFKGKLVSEGGMISRIPSGGINCEVEEDSSEWVGKPLPWSNAEK